jgi:hypothetical protein
MKKLCERLDINMKTDVLIKSAQGHLDKAVRALIMSDNLAREGTDNKREAHFAMCELANSLADVITHLKNH